MAYPVATMPDGRIKMSDGTIQSAPNSFNAGSAVSTIIPNQPASPQLPQVVKNFIGMSDSITNTPGGLAPSMPSMPESPQQQAQPMVGQQQAPQEAPEIIHDLSYAILSGMKPTEIPKYYPELEGMDTTLHSDMYSALQSGMPVDEASQYYPEIFPQEAKKNFLNDSSKREGLLENVGGFLTDTGEFMRDTSGSALAEIPSAVGDSLAFLSKVGMYTPGNMLATATRALFSNKTYDELLDGQKKEVDKLVELGNAASELFKRNADYNKDSVGASIGTFGTDVATSLIGPNKLGILKEGAGIIQEGAGFFKNVANLAGDGALQGAKYGVTTSDGKLDSESVKDIAIEAGIGSAGNLVLGGIVKTYGSIKEAKASIPKLKQYLAGLEPREITAIENASPEKINDVLRNAKESVSNQGDYLQSPYNKGAEEGAKVLDMIDDNFKKTQSERMAILEDVPVEKISLEAPRVKLKSSLKALNVEDIRIEDGNPVITPVSGREALVDFNNSSDVKALTKLNEILADDVSPMQTMDRIKKLQEWAYENKSTIGIKGTSAKMESLIKQVQGSMNDTFKKQLPGEYKKIMTSLSDDIKMKDDIQKLFGIEDNGTITGNRGELFMKRITSGTTTGGQARDLAIRIRDKYGVDLIQEARLRQIAMELVDDPRAKTFFGAIAQGKTGAVDWLVQKTVGKIVNKEEVIRNLAKGAKTTAKVQEPLYPKNLKEKLKAGKKAQENEKVRVKNFQEAERAIKKTAQEKLVASRIPGATKTTVETPLNPKRNESKVLAGKQGVMVEGKETFLLPRESTKTLAESATKERVALGEIAVQTSLARMKGGVSNDYLEKYIDEAISKGKLTREESVKILTEVKKSVANKEVRFSAEDMKKERLDTYIEEVKNNKKIESFEEMTTKKNDIQGEEIQISKTHKDLYDKLQKVANDGRYGTKTWDDLTKEFKEKTGKDIMDTGFDSFDEAGMIKKKSNAREKLVASRKSIAKPTEESKNAKAKEEKYRVAEDMNRVGLTTKILKGLGERETVSKEFIQNMTNSGDVKQVEKDIIRSLLETEGDKVNVADFKKKVQNELLPLERAHAWPDVSKVSSGGRYENIALAGNIRGEVKNYSEHIYKSPVKVSAGDIHFRESKNTENYFGHTRIEDMADNKTRRVIEVQSDLYQKGNLEKEKLSLDAEEQLKMRKKDMEENPKLDFYREKYEELRKRFEGLNKLQQYNDPTAHFRMIREEVAQASKDGITKLQFPTGETAMKIEGLGERDLFTIPGTTAKITTENMEVGIDIRRLGDDGDADNWVITDVLGDGKFKAVPKRKIERALASSNVDLQSLSSQDQISYLENHRKEVFDYSESFDISGKVDTNNPIYKFYEKEVGRYLKNKYNGNLVTDDKGVSWYEVEVKPEMAGPVEAFRAGKNITKNLTPEQVAEVKSLNKKLFGDNKLQITESILSNHEALGSYKDGMIKIVKGQANPKDTYLHEAVHKYLDVFTSEVEHTDILKYASKKYQIDDFVAVEEKLAEDFIKYTKDRTGFTGEFKAYFESLLSRIKAYFGNTDKIDTLYRDISKGKAKQEPKTAKERLLKSREG